MPAAASSPIAVLTAYATGQAADVEPGGDLLAVLARVPDPRKARGRRHRLVSVLGIAVAAVLAGARSWVAIAEWARDLPVSVRLRLGIGRDAPSEATIRRVLQRVDQAALDQALSGWLAARLPAPPRGRMQRIAVDGKTARGSRGPDRPGVHLLAALDHDSGVVLGQLPVDGKTNEITVFGPLLDRIDLTGVLVTADALHCQRGHADFLHARGAHYLLVAKANQPTLHQHLAGLPWPKVPVMHEHRERGHGREEHRRVKLLTAPIPFPHARLAVQIQRRRRPVTASTWERETVYAITDLTWRQAHPDTIAQALRGHWRIENQLHWIRDVTYGEDLSQIRTGNGPATMAALRNFAVSRHRLTGHTNIAAACRHTARHPNRALNLLT